jgi:hypothetical protein
MDLESSFKITLLLWEKFDMSESKVVLRPIMSRLMFNATKRFQELLTVSSYVSSLPFVSGRLFAR